MSKFSRIYNTEATAKIYIDEDISKPINISRGVRQGDTISPKIIGGNQGNEMEMGK